MHWLGSPGRWVSNTWPAGRSSGPAIMQTRWCMYVQTCVLLPDIRAAPVKLSLWYADVGEHVFEGDRLVEVLVGGATFDVAAPTTGTLLEKCVRPDQALQPGELLGRIAVENSRAAP